MSELAFKKDSAFIDGTGADFSVALRSYSATTQDRTGADILNLDSFRNKLISHKYPIWKFTVNDVPISATLQYEDSYWFAEVESLNVIGNGLSQEEAIRELATHIDNFVAFYENKDPGQLTGYANQLKDRFSTLVRRDD